MKIKISDRSFFVVEDIQYVEVEENTITIKFKNGLIEKEFYNNTLEADYIFNSLVNNLDVKDLRFHKETDSKKIDDRKEKAFDMFWNLYDKKIDVTRCKKSFMNLSLSEMSEAIKGVKIYVESTPDKKYRKNASTWINNKSWQNEVVVDKKKNRYIKPNYITDER